MELEGSINIYRILSDEMSGSAHYERRGQTAKPSLLSSATNIVSNKEKYFSSLLLLATRFFYCKVHVHVRCKSIGAVTVRLGQARAQSAYANKVVFKITLFGEGNRGNVSLKPEKFAKDGEQSTPQPAMIIDIRKILRFWLNFSKFLLKFS